MNKHRIMISMKDNDIPRETTTLTITTNDSLEIVSNKLNADFEKFDRAEGIAEKYREDGWSIESFVAYITHKHKKDWIIEEELLDKTFEFIGM